MAFEQPVTFSVSEGAVEELCDEIVGLLQNQELGTALVALALVVGKLATPDILRKEDEVPFAQALLDWAGQWLGGMSRGMN